MIKNNLLLKKWISSFKIKKLYNWQVLELEVNLKWSLYAKLKLLKYLLLKSLNKNVNMNMKNTL